MKYLVKFGKFSWVIIESKTKEEAVLTAFRNNLTNDDDYRLPVFVYELTVPSKFNIKRDLTVTRA